MISEYLANALLNAVLDGSAYSSPTNVHLGLSKGPPVFQTATVATEVSGGAYARQQMSFATADDGIDLNDTKLTFPNASGADWSTEADPITHWFIADGTTEGADNWLFAGKLECPLVVSDGDAGPVVYQKAIMVSLRGQLDS